METAYYKLPKEVDVNTVSLLDVVKMKLVTQKKKVEKTIDVQNNMTTTTIYLQRTTNRDSEKRKVVKSVVNKDGTKLYGENNVLLTNAPHTSNDILNYNNLKNEIAALDGNQVYGFNAKMEALTTSQKTALENDNHIVTVQPSGVYEIAKAGITVVIDPAQQIMEKRYYTNGTLMNSTTQKFTIADDGIHLIPIHKIEKIFETTASGTCWEYVKVSRYANYKIDGSTLRSEIDNSPKEIVVYPNPANSIVNIDLPFENGVDNIYNIMIINSLGSILHTYKATNEKTVQLSTENLPAGIYYALIEHNGIKTIQHFVKITE